MNGTHYYLKLTLLISGLFFLFVLYFTRCVEPSNNRLPILGESEIKGKDTIFHTIGPFSLYDQDSIEINNGSLSSKIYIANFFFTSCPTICPKTMKQMKRIQDKFEKDTSIALVSFSIDHYHDSTSVLKRYAGKMGVNKKMWHLLGGPKGYVHSLAKDYLCIALENKESPGGFDHNGNLILVDTKGHVRAFCDGTDPVSVDKFMQDVQLLKSEYLGEK